MYQTIGTKNPTYLLADPQGADVIAVPCEPGNGTVKRGMIMYRKSSGMYAPAAIGDVVNTNNLVVLDEEVNTNASMTIAEDARAYRAGRLIMGKVTLKEDGIVTAAHAVILRSQGIVLDGMESMGTFNNLRCTITYKANTVTGASVVAYANNGSAYIIAANTFTAPISKTFSKWNTKADGTGMDYAASASYIASADLMLYAIWA